MLRRARVLRAIYERMPADIQAVARFTNAPCRKLRRAGTWYAEALVTSNRSATSPSAFLKRVGALAKVRPYTLLTPARLNALYDMATAVDREHIPGDVVECGVWNGGGSGMVARSLQASDSEKHQWLFDSFQGLPEPEEVDGPMAVGMAGELRAHPERVASIVSSSGRPMDRVHIVQGWFEETLPKADVRQVALLHIDADWYSSVKLCLNLLYDRVSPGGFIVFDDYGYWEGCRAAVQEFWSERGITNELIQIDSDSYYIRKDG